MDLALQQQARALGDPTRYGIFRYIADADRPVEVAELTEHFGFNHNAIRQHLAKLTDAELIVEDKVSSGGPGRPRLCYTVSASTESRWDVTGPYERLSLMLSEVIQTGDSPVEVGRRVGLRRRLGAGAVVDPVAGLTEQMARHGFEPRVTTSRDGVRIVLQRCPFAKVAAADPDSVCNLHLGIAYGIAESVGGLVIDELRPKDPYRAQCILRCHPS